MFDTITTYIKFAQRNNILREVVTDMIICSEFTQDSFIGGKQIGNLNIQLLISLMADKMNFFVAGSTNCDFVATAKEFQIHNIF